MIARVFGIAALLCATVEIGFAQVSVTTTRTERSPKPAEKSSPQSPTPSKGSETATTGPTTTEIYADEASFDSANRIGVFKGHVKVIDPRFTLQSDQLTVHINKAENQGLEKAVAEGNVGIVREKAANGTGPAERAVGRANTAVYIGKTGNMELTGSPRVQQGINSHVATSPETVMILNQGGQLTTHGPSRTEIHQQPKADENGEEKPDKDAERKAERNSDKESDLLPKP